MVSGGIKLRGQSIEARNTYGDLHAKENIKEKREQQEILIHDNLSEHLKL